MSVLVAFWFICDVRVLVKKVCWLRLVSVLVAHLHMKFYAINTLLKRCDLIASWCSVLVPSFFHTRVQLVFLKELVFRIFYFLRQSAENPNKACEYPKCKRLKWVSAIIMLVLLLFLEQS